MSLNPDGPNAPEIQPFSALLLRVMVAIALNQREAADRDAMIAILRKDGWIA